MSSPFTTPALDDRARPILASVFAGPPDEELLRAAMLLDDRLTAPVLAQHATWLAAARALATAGFTPEEIARVHVRAAMPGLAPVSPRPQVLLPQLEPAFGVTLAREIADALLADPTASPPMRGAGQAALVRLAAAGALEPADEALFDRQLAGFGLLRALVRALPPDRREAFALAHAPETTSTMGMAASALELLHDIRDLVDTPALAARRAAYLDATKDHHFHDDFAESERTGTVVDEPRPTSYAQIALKQVLADLETARRIAAIGSVVERAWTERAVTVDAPELATLAAWRDATDARRRAIADDVARAIGANCTVTGIETFADASLPIAVLTIDGERFSLVPGDTVDVGLSDAEEQLIREVAATHEADDMYEEMYASLLERIGAMRPVTRVRVGPLLAAQCAGEVSEPAAIAASLEKQQQRAPSEAEWEYLARGGRTGEPTFRGPALPDSAAWFEATRNLGASGANAFGLWLFGFDPELCADAWHPTHDGMSRDGSPRCGSGPRTTRGGAAQLYPWQDTGEWHLLLTAMRTPQSGWEYALCVRPTIAIRIGVA